MRRFLLLFTCLLLARPRRQEVGVLGRKWPLSVCYSLIHHKKCFDIIKGLDVRQQLLRRLAALITLLHSRSCVNRLRGTSRNFCHWNKSKHITCGDGCLVVYLQPRSCSLPTSQLWAQGRWPVDGTVWNEEFVRMVLRCGKEIQQRICKGYKDLDGTRVWKTHKQSCLHHNGRLCPLQDQNHPGSHQTQEMCQVTLVKKRRMSFFKCSQHPWNCAWLWF